MLSTQSKSQGAGLAVVGSVLTVPNDASPDQVCVVFAERETTYVPLNCKRVGGIF